MGQFSHLAPGSAIITEYLFARQQQVAGTYKITSGGNRVRAWKPPRSIHRKMQALVFARDRGTCGICDAKVKPGLWELDHIKPYKHGGIYIEWNLRVACCWCNAAKGARWDD
jgi:5-methylcytosine-specific restriction endonuclease McrA